MSDTRTPSTQTSHDESQRSARSQRTWGELVFDIFLVCASLAYLYVARGYPPDGRQIPMVIGSVALIAGGVQLVGFFVPQLWKFTHGDAEAKTIAVPTPATELPATERATADLAEGAADTTATHESRDTAVIMAWSAGFLGAILAIGYVWAVPLFFLAYFGARRSWPLAGASAVVMWVLTQFVFVDLLTIPLPSGAWF